MYKTLEKCIITHQQKDINEVSDICFFSTLCHILSINYESLILIWNCLWKSLIRLPLISNSLWSLNSLPPIVELIFWFWMLSTGCLLSRRRLLFTIIELFLWWELEYFGFNLPFLNQAWNIVPWVSHFKHIFLFCGKFSQLNHFFLGFIQMLFQFPEIPLQSSICLLWIWIRSNWSIFIILPCFP